MTGAAPIRILLVEDHASFSQALTGMVGFEPDLTVVAAVTDGEAAADTAEDARPDVAVVDLDLPGGSGVEVIAELRARLPGVRCVVLTALTDPVELGRAVEAGAKAVHHKSIQIDALFDVIRDVARGVSRLDAADVTAWLGALAADRESRWEERVARDLLSPREHEVLLLLAHGVGSAGIAETLVITEATARTHIRNLRTKLGAATRVEAVAEAIRLRLLDPTG